MRSRSSAKSFSQRVATAATMLSGFVEIAEVFVHGPYQAFMRRGLPCELMSHNGSAMTVGEVADGLHRLGIVPARVLAAALSRCDRNAMQIRSGTAAPSRSGVLGGVRG